MSAHEVLPAQPLVESSPVLTEAPAPVETLQAAETSVLRRILRLGATAFSELGYALAPELRWYGSAQEEAPSTVAEAMGIGRAEAAALIEQRGYACPARWFADQVQDATRQNTFAYEHSYYGDAEGGEMTEHEGLVQLRNYLCRGFDRQAASMSKNLTFIGEKEYAEGAAGLADYWKQYLDSDPETQLCALTPISGQYQFKSDRYLLERILEHFTDEELEQYKGRLLIQPGELSAPPEKVRVVMLDDWVISGKQMGDAYYSVHDKVEEKYLDQVEINVLTAPSGRIERGLSVSSSWQGWSRTIPMKAYFLAHDANGPVEFADNNAYISGTHSRVDFDFHEPIGRLSSKWMWRLLDEPALGRIISSYYENNDCPQYDRVARLTSA